MNRATTAKIALALGAALLTSIYAFCMGMSDAYRTARDYAGDEGLPGASLLPSAADVADFASRIGDGLGAYRQVLTLDDGLVVLTWFCFFFVALLARHSLGSPVWARALLITSTLAALSDLSENHLLRQVLSNPTTASHLLLAATARATTAKWLFFVVSVALTTIELALMLASISAWLKALFLDVPYLVDSLVRRLDFQLHREFVYDPDHPTSPVRPLRWWQRPAFWFYGVTVIFVSFGPTWDGICTILPPLGPSVLLWVAGITFVVVLGCVVWAFWWWLNDHLGKRFYSRVPRELAPQRYWIAGTAMGASAGLMLLPVVTTAVAFGRAAVNAPGICSTETASAESLWRLGLCLVAIGTFMLACALRFGTPVLLVAQGALFVFAGFVQWHWLAPSSAVAAAQIPYRHVFGVVVPAACFTLCFAPFVASAMFWPGPKIRRWFGLKAVEPATRARFQALLLGRELFVNRPDPELTVDRVLLAVVHGTLYRPLHLLLLPALIAFVVPADWVFSLTGSALVFTAFLLTWGSMTSRWQELVQHLERWFMTGTTLLISVCVIAIAALRVLKVGYVTTILDAAPFGILFGVVTMSYILSWFLEYWLNRVAAVELLGILGAPAGDTDRAYALDRAAWDPTVRVEPEGRHVMAHGLGRFLIVGRVALDPREPPAQEQPVVAPVTPEGLAPRETAFHTYDLLGLFRALATHEDDDRVVEVSRHLDLYFYTMNFLLILVLVGFVCGYVYLADSSLADAVVIARVDAEPTALVDLARLLSPQERPVRPAVVVVASGGGTRAALYTAHVLEGLHRLGVDSDIVLTSGVSGGGVALAYFTANVAQLTGDRAAERPVWGKFRENMAEPFIQDVLAGASEWRIFGQTPLTVLLAESFERRLFRGFARPPTLAAVAAAPPLILNTTVVGHPIEDSDVLRATLDAPSRALEDRCREFQRPYRMMNGGRLIFTNLKNTSAFPKRDSVLPDTRLPYRIVRDPGVSLARAAALTANFPPVFPSARVVVTSETAECMGRSYFVTDGGAEENLGLVSALFAVRSALLDTKANCAERHESKPASRRDPKCQLVVRPIHFVIAEASATSYDYDQDRGVSAVLSGAKERMTGGLTEELIHQTNELYRSLNGSCSGKAEMCFHYIALPLVFRTRGGFGTHWMQADHITVSDPRTRYGPRLVDRLLSPTLQLAVTLGKSDLNELWTALHNPDLSRPFCGSGKNTFRRSESETVRRWICSARKEPRGIRDLHIEEWQRLVTELKDAS